MPYTMEEPTNYLRFVERGGKFILQQRIAVKSFNDNHGPIGVVGEWRDVPVELESE